MGDSTQISLSPMPDDEIEHYSNRYYRTGGPIIPEELREQRHHFKPSEEVQAELWAMRKAGKTIGNMVSMLWTEHEIDVTPTTVTCWFRKQGAARLPAQAGPRITLRNGRRW